MEEFHQIKELLKKGALDGIYPGAVLLVAYKGKIVFFDKAGQSSFNPSNPMNVDTIFDLASLTKPLATTLALMKCVDDDKIDLDQPIGSLLSEPLPKDKEGLTTKLLLAHCAGFADWKPFYLDLVKYEPETRKQFVRKWIMEAPLVYKPGEETLYSDLGFIILEWVIEKIIGEPLHEFLSRNFYSPLSMKKTFFSGTSLPLQIDENQIASTEDCPWRNIIIKGSVHDENAYALGGYSGHSGLFGTAEDVHTLVDLLMSHFLGQKTDYLKPETVRTFFTRQDIVKGSTRALGWDTPSSHDSSSGKYFSDRTVGHLGYTGTSLWMDLKQDLIVIFLTNRVHPSRKNEKIRAFRPLIHDLVMEEIVINGRD